MRRNNRGFFDAGLGLALLALFSLAASAIATSEPRDAGQQLASCVATAGDNRPDAGCDSF